MNIDCVSTNVGFGYMGSMSVTSSGLTCQRWDSQSPYTHGFTTDTMYPDMTVTSAGNSCRNPDGGDAAPWCYTTDPQTRWGYCNVPLCPLGKSNIQHEIFFHA